MKTLYIVGAVALASLLSYAGISYYGQKQLALQLNQVLDDTLKEKEQLQSSLERIQAQLKDKEDKLAGLSDVQGIKSALINAQSNIENLNNELQKFNRDRAALQEANVGLTTRLQNTTKEYIRTMDELKTAQDLVAKLNKGFSPDKKKLDDANKIIEDKNKELARQKAELDGLKASSQGLMASNKAMEQRLKDLESSRGVIQANVENLQGELGAREAPSKQLQATIASLRGELSQRESRIAELEDRLDQQAAAIRRSAPAAGDRKSSEIKAEMERLSGILVRKEFEIDGVKKEVLAAKAELDKEKKRNENSNAMYDNLKAQISQFSDAISAREAEIEGKRREIDSLKAEIAGLRTRSSQLENDLLESKESQKKILGDLSAAVRLNSVLQERIRSASSGLEPAYSPSSSEDRRRADELKRKVEVILEPDKQ
jgi:chromosome segregation ATPase